MKTEAADSVRAELTDQLWPEITAVLSASAVLQQSVEVRS